MSDFWAGARIGVALLLAVVCLPWVVYVCAKCATLGYLRARKFFDETTPTKEKD